MARPKSGMMKFRLRYRKGKRGNASSINRKRYKGKFAKGFKTKRR